MLYLSDAILFQKDGKTINLEAILPPPENMFRGNIGQKEEADCKKKGIPTWYEWQTRNWGTKWNAYEGSYEVNSPTVISLQFDTAWAPPLGVFSALPGCDAVDPNIVLNLDGTVTVSWMGIGELWSSPAVDGVYMATGETSPHTFTPLQQSFFQLVCP